jgi:3-phosphoshikimate 1-carboxyvinyltransferase
MWPAPTAPRPLDAVVEVPTSKSLMARALVVAALAEEPTVIHRPLVARDSLLMAEGLRGLGAAVDTGMAWTVVPGRPTAPARVDCGLSGTVMRFLPPVAALGDVPVHFDGDPRARQRPLGPLLDALRDLGVRTTPTRARSLPVTVHGRGAVPGGSVVVDAAGSSQLVSGLLLAGCRFAGGLEVQAGGDVPSLPHVTMTLDVLAHHGVPAQRVDDRRWRVAEAVPTGGQVQLEPDLSNAAVFAAAAVVAGGRVRVPGWPEHSAQPGAAVLDLLRRAGAGVEQDPAGVTVTGTGRVPGLGTVDMSDLGELVPTLVALAAVADGPSTFTGVAHLRGHETDRLAALVTEVRRLGGVAQETADGLLVEPAPLTGTAVECYDDHRMATFGCLVGLVVPGVTLTDVGATSKTMPEFPDLWTGMLR